MAKSLRSKPKLRAKSVKRKGEFLKVSDARSARIAEKLKENLAKQKEEKMEDAAEEPKESKSISTAGWRQSSRRRMKQKRNKKNSTKF